jgi:Kef-type K+ transport system membrane component KefB
LIITYANIILLIALALLSARVLGFLFDRFKQPAVIGEILAGLLLGGIGVFFFTGQTIHIFSIPIVLPNLDFTSDLFTIFAELGILFMLFISGLQTSLSKLKKMGKSSGYSAIGGVVVPLLFGVGIGIVFDFSVQESFVIGMILVATSVGVTVRTLLDMHQLDSDVGVTILGGAVIDDVLGIILIAFLIGVDSPMVIGIKIVIFFLIFLYLGLRIIDKILLLGERIHLPKALLSIALSVFLIYTFFADQFGIAGIIGAFVAGLIIGNTVKFRRIIDDVQTIGYSLLIPLFFVWIGARIWTLAPGDTISYGSIGVFAIAFIIMAILGKILGCGIGASLSGLSFRESLFVGVGMIPRMELALIIVTAALANNMFFSAEHEHQILVSTVLLAIVTTLITPILMKTVNKSNKVGR